MENIEVKDIEFENKDTQLCANCQTSPAVACGYLETCNHPLDPVEYDCTFEFEDTIVDILECDDCPLCWCKECKDKMVVDTYIFRDKCKGR